MTQFAFPASLTEQDGLGATVVAWNSDPKSSRALYQADSSHPHFDDILAGLRSGDPEVWGLFDIVGGVMAKLRTVTERISWNGAEVLVDGDPIHSTLSDQLARAIQVGRVA